MSRVDKLTVRNVSFVARHWFEIVLSASTVFAGAVVSSLFYWLQSRSDASLAQERARQAWQATVDILENDIINKREVTERSILNLVAAIERTRNVSFSELLSSHRDIVPAMLLQDVELRLRMSKHLDPTEKGEYVHRIEELIAEIRGHPRRVPGGQHAIMSLLKATKKAIQNDDKDDAIEGLELLEQALAIPAISIVSSDQARSERWRIRASLIAGLAAIIAVSALVLDVFALAANLYVWFIVGFLAAGILGYVLQQVRLARDDVSDAGRP